jgi:hypothetical protein
MLRFFVLLLLVLNGAYFAWTHDWLRAYGLAPERQAESQRLAQQIEPQAIRVLTHKQAQEVEARLKAKAPAKAPECLQAGPFEERQAAELRRALESAALPTGAWTLEATTEPVRWLVYMGKYAHPDMVAKKRAELAVLGIKPLPLDNPELEPGLSLGAFDTQAQAQAELQAFNRRGIRTARVLPERAVPAPQHWLRVPAADEAQRARLDGLKSEALAAKPLQTCK